MGTVDYVQEAARNKPLNEYQVVKNRLISSIRALVEGRSQWIRRVFNNGRTGRKRFHRVYAENFFRCELQPISTGNHRKEKNTGSASHQKMGKGQKSDMIKHKKHAKNPYPQEICPKKYIIPDRIHHKPLNNQSPQMTLKHLKIQCQSCH